MVDGRGQRGICPGHQQKGSAERGCGNFLRHDNYKNSVHMELDMWTQIDVYCVEARISMEGQIMCVEQCTF